MKTIIRLLITAVLVIIISKFMGGVSVENITSSIIVAVVLAILNEKESKRKESIEKLKGKIESERVKRESEPFKSLNSHTEEDSKHTLKTQTSQGANKLKLQLQLIESDTKGMTNPGSMTVTALKRPIYPSLAFKISTLTTSLKVLIFSFFCSFVCF